MRKSSDRDTAYVIGGRQAAARKPREEPSPHRPSPGKPSSHKWYRVLARRGRVLLQAYGDDWWTQWTATAVAVPEDYETWVRNAKFLFLVDAVALDDPRTVRPGVVIDSRRPRHRIEVGSRPGSGELALLSGPTFKSVWPATEQPPRDFHDALAEFQGLPRLTTTTALTRDVLRWVWTQLAAWPASRGGGFARFSNGEVRVGGPDGGTMMRGLDAFPDMLLSARQVEVAHAWTRRLTHRHLTFHEPRPAGGGRSYVAMGSPEGDDRIVILTPDAPPDSNTPEDDHQTAFACGASLEDLLGASSLARTTLTRSTDLMSLDTRGGPGGEFHVEAIGTADSPSQGGGASPVEVAAFRGAYPCDVSHPVPGRLLLHPATLLRALRALETPRVKLGVSADAGLLFVEEEVAAESIIRRRSWLRTFLRSRNEPGVPGVPGVPEEPEESEESEESREDGT